MRPAMAALRGDLGALVLAHARYPVLNAVCTLNAARSGSLQCLSFVHQHGASWHVKTTAVARGLECLEYAHSHGAPWHPQSTDHAARGDLACLRYCHEHGATWGRLTTYIAAMAASVDCLRYAVEHGAPRHHLVIETCIRNVMDNPGSDPCVNTLTYAVDAGLPYCTRIDPYQRRQLARLYEQDPGHHAVMQVNSEEIKTAEVAVFVAVLRRLHSIRVIQRAWRAWPDLVRERRLQGARKRRAVDVIQLAYLAWTCRPGCGRTYKRARSSFEDACVG